MFRTKAIADSAYRKARAEIIVSTFLKIQRHCAALSFEEANTWMLYERFTFVTTFSEPDVDRLVRRSMYKDTLNRIDLNYSVYLLRDQLKLGLQFRADGYFKLCGLTIIGGSPIGIGIDETCRERGGIGSDTIETKKILLQHPDFVQCLVSKIGIP